MIFTVGNIKGGVGKTVLAVNIAAALAQEGRDVLLAGLDGIKALPLMVGRRKAFPNAFTAGLSVAEQFPRDPKAAGELLSVVNALYAQGTRNDYQSTPRCEVV